MFLWVVCSTYSCFIISATSTVINPNSKYRLLLKQIQYEISKLSFSINSLKKSVSKITAIELSDLAQSRDEILLFISPGINYLRF